MSASTAVRHPMTMVMRARELREAGWSLKRVADHLATEFGCSPPAHNTVLRWCDPAYGQRHSALRTRRNRQASIKRTTFAIGAKTTPEYRDAFMRELAAVGVPSSSIAKVHGVVFGVPIDADRVRRLVAA